MSLWDPETLTTKSQGLRCKGYQPEASRTKRKRDEEDVQDVATHHIEPPGLTVWFTVYSKPNKVGNRAKAK